MSQETTKVKKSKPKMTSRMLSLIGYPTLMLMASRTLAFTPNSHPNALFIRSVSQPISFRASQKRTVCWPVNGIHTTRRLTPTTRSSSALNSISESVAELAASLFRYQGPVPFVQALGINAVLFAALQSKLFTMLTPSGFASSLALGTMLWATLGWRGWTLCVLYLFLGQAVTKVKFEDKEKRGIAEGRGGRRGPENVWGSALTALVCAACSVQSDPFLGISSQLYQLGYVTALATKLSDTFASEIGKAYGKTTFLITTLERVEPGTEGAVSAEGTAAALVGGSLLPLYGWAVGLIDGPSVLIATISAFIACNVESLIGATLQEKKGFEWMSNEVVNFFNTLVGAGLAFVGGTVFLGM